ncbi:tRNA1(Val) (adenine(37)-N6)-methyltransferase [Acidocella aromatica]|uniref:tRNA1(Val) A37 N6-methylase TrmN6 n=1 Tax=Acidocella aromatica TaxID=1303579 RepID=A0A840VNC6_9PROT|nr:methyltransferase domain-containing protein [Acidocella aromatica]MBB5371842.1 tRNA1(Val) A37 N6-methylase TrmN6 [Acidocella aromatica]
MDEISTGGLLDGRLVYRQLRDGHRSGFEPVLLAAAVPAREGELVLEAGTGAGAALLCLGARVAGIRGVGVEREARMAELASENFSANQLPDISALRGNATALPFAPDTFHHVLANPPWFAPRGTPSPDARRDLAHRAADGLLSGWVSELTRVLRGRGSISLILPAASFAEAAAALKARHCGAITLIPLWPRTGQAAKMVIITARKHSKSPDVVHPGLVLHDESSITPEAEAILRGGAALG